MQIYKLHIVYCYKGNDICGSDPMVDKKCFLWVVESVKGQGYSVEIREKADRRTVIKEYYAALNGVEMFVIGSIIRSK